MALRGDLTFPEFSVHVNANSTILQFQHQCVMSQSAQQGEATLYHIMQQVADEAVLLYFHIQGCCVS